MASKGMEDIVKQISELSVKDLAALIKQLEEEFGVSAAAMATAAPAAGAGQVAAPAVEEKAEYKVTLKESGADKMKVIKALRTLVQGISIVDAKDKVENAPVVIAEAAPKDEAMKMKDELEKAGAKVELA